MFERKNPPEEDAPTINSRRRWTEKTACWRCAAIAGDQPRGAGETRRDQNDPNAAGSVIPTQASSVLPTAMPALTSHGIPAVRLAVRAARKIKGHNRGPQSTSAASEIPVGAQTSRHHLRRGLGSRAPGAPSAHKQRTRKARQKESNARTWVPSWFFILRRWRGLIANNMCAGCR